MIVPARRGTTAFQLKDINSLEQMQGEIPTGTPVLVTFTVSWFDWNVDETDSSPVKSGQRSPSKLKKEGFERSLSFNLQEVVVLHEIEEDEGGNDAGDETDGSAL